MTAAARWFPAYVALGSNLDDPAARVSEAMHALSTLPDCRLEIPSSNWRTRPVGPQDQPDFVNACAAVLTRRDAASFHAQLQSLEHSLGKRAPVVRWGPRRIDLDVLVHGDTVCSTATLELPHPRMHERAFVLYPLAEIAPDLVVPGRGRVAAMRSMLEGRMPAGDAPVRL